MKVSGFTIVRNAIKYDYPAKEAIMSVLPVCDEFIVAVGNSDDGTRQMIESIQSDKIRIVDTIWDDAMREGGRTLAKETDKAFAQIATDADWGFYIQADEVLPEKYYNAVREGMEKYKDDEDVDGLLFNYLHFYGSYDYVGESWRWYRREIRIIRNRKDIFSYKDAQGFRKKPNEKLKVKLINAFIYHYGWVKNPKIMQQKNESLHMYWDKGHPQATSNKEFNYAEVDSLVLFNSPHPSVMQSRIQARNWKFNYDISGNRFSLKERLKRMVAKITGYRIGEYRNYKIV